VSNPLLIQTRAALLDAVEALGRHSDQVVVIGAQAVHLRTGDADVALAESTKDADLALDPRCLEDDPLIHDALTSAGFELEGGNPGQWLSPGGIPVDLLLPSELSGRNPKRRSVRIPPHSDNVARNTRGIEGCVIDYEEMFVPALDPDDGRVCRVKVAGAAGLLVAKLIKIGERAETPHRLIDKDAHDSYRLLVATPTESMASRLAILAKTDISADVTNEALEHLADLFAEGAEALGSMMAGRAEEGVGEPATVAASVSVLAADLLGQLKDLRRT
jgi:hypothetical protein